MTLPQTYPWLTGTPAHQPSAAPSASGMKSRLSFVLYVLSGLTPVFLPNFTCRLPLSTLPPGELLALVHPLCFPFSVFADALPLHHHHSSSAVSALRLPWDTSSDPYSSPALPPFSTPGSLPGPLLGTDPSYPALGCPSTSVILLPRQGHLGTRLWKSQGMNTANRGEKVPEVTD